MVPLRTTKNRGRVLLPKYTMQRTVLDEIPGTCRRDFTLLPNVRLRPLPLPDLSSVSGVAEVAAKASAALGLGHRRSWRPEIAKGG